MPRVEFAQENKRARVNYDFPKLKLKNGETARLLVMEAPNQEYVHRLQAPQVINGVPQMTKVERRGKEVDDYKYDFLSSPICLGDESVLKANGSDPKNCPMCALAKESAGSMVQAPKPRYAMHVIRYATKDNGTKLTLPFRVELVVWSFTDTIFDKIADWKAEWGDIREHDLVLGPCSNEMFQKADLNIAAKAFWRESQEYAALVAETFKENQIEDLAIACGSRKPRQFIEEDLETIREKWSIATGTSAATSNQPSLGQGLDALLDDLPKSAGGNKPDVAEESDDSADDTGDLDLLTASVAKPKAKAAAKAPAEVDEADLDALLADID